MSHEIRTPFNEITGMADLMLDTCLDDEQRDGLETVKSCADQVREATWRTRRWRQARVQHSGRS